MMKHHEASSIKSSWSILDTVLVLTELCISYLLVFKISTFIHYNSFLLEEQMELKVNECLIAYAVLLVL